MTHNPKLRSWIEIGCLYVFTGYIAESWPTHIYWDFLWGNHVAIHKCESKIKISVLGLGWWLTLVIPAPGRMRQEDPGKFSTGHLSFNIILAYTSSPYFKTKSKTKRCAFAEAMFRGCEGHGASAGWEVRIAGPVLLVRLGRQHWLPRLSAVEEPERPVHFWILSS